MEELGVGPLGEKVCRVLEMYARVPFPRDRDL